MRTCYDRHQQPAASPAAGTENIDRDKARQLLQRDQRGEKLSEAEQSYLNKAKELRKQRGGGAVGQRKAPAALKPLCDMTAEDRY